MLCGVQIDLVKGVGVCVNISTFSLTMRVMLSCVMFLSCCFLVILSFLRDNVSSDRSSSVLDSKRLTKLVEENQVLSVVCLSVSNNP